VKDLNQALYAKVLFGLFKVLCFICNHVYDSFSIYTIDIRLNVLNKIFYTTKSIALRFLLLKSQTEQTLVFLETTKNICFYKKVVLKS